MQVLIDCGRIRNDRVGLGEVAKQYAAALARSGQDMDFLFLTHPKFKAFAQLAREIGVVHVRGKFSLRNKIIRLFDKEVFPYVYNGKSHDVRHALYGKHLDIPARDKKPFILTLHDMHFVNANPKGAPQVIRRLQKSVARADVVCFISKYAREIVAEYINLSGKETRIVYNGTEKPRNPRRPQWFKDEMRPFLLGISEVALHKQYHLVPPMLKHLPEMSLIVAGKQKTGMSALSESIRQNDMGERVVTPGLINDEEKAFLLQECAGFVHPSSREGFGMPVVEALHYGKPVFCFPVTALTEVGGKCAFYWESETPAEMAELVAQCVETALLRALTASPPSSEILQARAAWAAEFAWDKNVSAYVELYKQLAGR